MPTQWGRPPRAVLYARRHPRARAVPSRASPRAQLDLLRRHAEGLGWDIVGCFEDGPGDVSGLLDAVHALDRGGVLLTLDASRLGVSTQAAAWEGVIASRGGRVVYMDDSAGPSSDHREVMTRFLDYRQRLLDKRKGRPVATEPGEKAVSDVIGPILEAEDKAVALHDRGKNPREISESLNSRGYRARGGRAWTGDMVRNVLRRRKLVK